MDKLKEALKDIKSFIEGRIELKEKITTSTRTTDEPVVSAYKDVLFLVNQHIKALQEKKEESKDDNIMRRFHCPICGTYKFGSAQNEDGTLTRHCHGYKKGMRCCFSFHEKDDNKYFVEQPQ